MDTVTENESRLHWVPSDSYSVALAGDKLICRNAKGTVLKSVPKKVRDSDVGRQLLELRDWLAGHRQACHSQVETWMLRSLPVPSTAITAVWADPSWRAVLDNTVVGPLINGDLDHEQTGFCKGTNADGRVGIVDLDGETVWLDSDVVAIPHPILLTDLDDFRELAVELEFGQGIAQLFRETHHRPDDLAGSDRTTVDDYRNGRFNQLMHVVGRCRTLGYRVQGGFATCPVFEDGRNIEARYWIGSEFPDSETYTGDLLWLDHQEQAIALADVGPVAYSEGVRMAQAIYSNRVVDEQVDQ